MLGKIGLWSIASLLVLALAGCGERSEPAAPPPPTVATMHVNFNPVALTTELPGRLEPWRVAQVRARVGGIVQRRLFTEGSVVEAGQPLFQIEAAEYQAAYDSATAAVASAEVALRRARSQLQRFKSLVKTSALSQQAYDDAMFAEQQAVADLEAARAAARSAQIDLDHTLVRAPLTGRIGRSLVTEGALVGDGEVTHLATIHQLEPIYVNFMQSANEVLAIRRSMLVAKQAEAEPSSRPIEVRLVLDDGSEYPHAGELLFSDITVDPSSGQILLRAQIPNPDQLLLPGMYVRARVEQQPQRAALIPQQAATRNDHSSTVLVVADDGLVEARSVTINGSKNNHWVVVDGLREGEEIIVEGAQKARPGGTVETVPWQQQVIATRTTH